MLSTAPSGPGTVAAIYLHTQLYKPVQNRGCISISTLVAVMWSETLRLRTKTGLRQKKLLFVLVLVLQVLCCVVKHGLVTLVVVMILKDTATFQVLFIGFFFYYVLGTSLQWRSTVAFTYLKVKSAKYFCLLTVVLVLVLLLRPWS